MALPVTGGCHGLAAAAPGLAMAKKVARNPSWPRPLAPVSSLLMAVRQYAWDNNSKQKKPGFVDFLCFSFLIMLASQVPEYSQVVSAK